MTLLDGPDLFHLTQETPGHPTHTVKVAILDGEVDDGTVGAWLQDIVPRVPPAWSYQGRLSVGIHAYRGAGDLDQLGVFLAEEVGALIGSSPAPASP